MDGDKTLHWAWLSLPVRVFPGRASRLISTA